MAHGHTRYPKAWADYLRDSGRQIYTKKVRRGFFCSGSVKPSGKYYESNFDDFRDKYVSIHMSGNLRTTPYHEIEHMVEFFNPNALRISKEFIKARTQGKKQFCCGICFQLVDTAFKK